MDTDFIIGTIAAILTTVSFLPQVIKTVKTRDTKSLSLPMYLLFVTGVILWIIYGISNKQAPIILGNTVTLLFASIILCYKIRALWK